LFGKQFAVCVRCFSVYSGLFIGVVFYPVFRMYFKQNTPNLIYLLISILLLLLDLLMNIFKIIENSFITKTITGIIFGFVLSLYLIPGLFFLNKELKIFHKKNNE
jgi:uncharacterized membrane protein